MQELDLKSNGLTELPSSIGDLVKLSKIGLDENKLTVVPSCFKNLTTLRDLSMAKNRIKTIETDALSSLENLVMLDLH